MPTVPIYDFDTDFALKVRQVIRVVQSDIGREFVCHAKFNGQAWDLTGFTGTVLGVKPDGNATDTTATIDEDEFKFTLTEQMAAVAGAYEIFLTVENGSDVKIQAPVLLCVLEGADGVISESALGALTELLQASQEALAETSQYATAAATSAEEAEDAADRAEAAADSILVDVTDRTPYLLRQSGGGVEIGDREYDTIVGGTVAWNQLYDKTYPTTVSREGFTFTVQSDGKISVSGTTEGIKDTYYQLTKKLSLANHVVFLSGCPEGGNASSGYDVYLDGNSNSDDIGNGKIFKPTVDDKAFYIRIRKAYTQTMDNLIFAPQIIDLTQMFGSTIADYIYSLEQATAGAGVAWFRQFFPEDYYAYNAGELLSVSGVSAHVMRDADDNIIGNYPLDDSLTLRGLPKLDGGNLYYDGDTYESDGTVTRKYGVIVLNGSQDIENVNWRPTDTSVGWIYPASVASVPFVNSSEYAPIACDKLSVCTYGDLYGGQKTDGVGVTNKQGSPNRIVIRSSDTSLTTKNAINAYLANHPITVVFHLYEPTTETADPFTNPQVVDPDGTEQYVTDSIVPVGHETIYRTNLLDNLNNILKAPTADGTYTMKVTVSNGEATYFWD